MKLWGGRFTKETNELVHNFNASLSFDSKFYKQDINGSIAHVNMLAKQNIVTNEERFTILNALEQIKTDIETGALEINPKYEDIHSFVEATLIERIGDTGKKLHTGRSRNDQIALDERLYLRRVIPLLQNEIVTLIETLSGIAAVHTTTLLTGYTHMQHAQPGTLAQHLCAWSFMLVRDWERIEDALSRISKSPLGSGALQGSTLPLNRERVASLLSFDGVTDNSLDTVSDRDYCIEFTSAFAVLQSHLSRMCEEIVLWSTTEFAFVDLSEKWSTGSSIMPQKKNPDFAELIRGRTGKVYGDLINLLTMVKGLPLAYDRDLQEDKEPLFDALDTVEGNLKVFTAMISSAKWNKTNLEKSVEGGFANATDVAEYLVKKGMPFRTAHSVSAKCVRTAIDKGFDKIEDLKIEDLKSCSDLIDSDIFDCLSPRKCAMNRKTTGGPSEGTVRVQLETLKNLCNKFRK